MGKKRSSDEEELIQEWEQKLANLGLSMRRGEHKRLMYGHDFNRLPDDGGSLAGGRRQSLSQIEQDGFGK